jgi:tetratricopeptide (TPR) repeat protein
MRNFYLVFFLLLVIQFGCTPKKHNGIEVEIKPNRTEVEKKLSIQDSVKFMQYLDKAGEFSLFSMKRQLYIDSALAIVPTASQLWQQKAMPLFKQKKYEIGMPYLDSAVKYDKSKHWLEYRAFIKCIFQKSYRDALVDFNLAQEQNGNSYIMDHSYEFYKGLCYLQLNQLDSAEYFVTKCINEELKDRDENSAHHLHWFYLGVIQYEKEDFIGAAKSFDSSLRQYAQFSDAQFYKALCLKQENQAKEALALLLNARENLQRGYTINESNAIYEAYPYQINKFMLDAYIESFQLGE